MNSQTRALIGVALGQIPKVGGLLSGLFDIAEPDTFNSELLTKLEDIEDTLEALQNQITQLGLDLTMDQLYAEQNQAEAHINSWYYNHVKPWLQGNNTGNKLDGKYLSTATGTTGEIILNKGTQMLDNINSAILGQLDNEKNKWLQLVIKRYLAVDDTTRMNNQIDSYLEMSYKYWLHLIHLQLKGIACLRAINSDQLGQYIGVVRDNIIQQGLECQKIVNQNLSKDDFTWVGTGGNGWPPSGHNFKITDEDNRYVNTDENKVNSGSVSTGIQFGWPASGRNQWGAQIASGTLEKDGSIASSNQSWDQVPFGSNVNLVPSRALTHTRGFLQYSTDTCCLSPGQVITGIQLDVTQREGWPQSAWFYNTFAATITYSDIQPDLTLGPGKTRVLDPSTVDTANDQYVAVDQLTSLSTPYTSTPITGFGFTTMGNQLAVRLQTSIHQNAFAPVPINSSYWAALYSPVAPGFLKNDNGISEFVSGASEGEPGFLLLGLSNPPRYGDEVTIMQTSAPLALLGATGGQVEFAAPGTATHSRWILVNPANVKGDYGTQPVPEIYNWSAILFKLADSDQDLYLKVDAQKGAVTLDTPTESQVAQVNHNVTRIDDSSYYWNAHPNPGQTNDAQPRCLAWAGQFDTHQDQTQLLYYWPENHSWWIGGFDETRQDFDWKPVGNTEGFGNLDDGRPFWTGDFSDTGEAEVLFYFPGDGNFWLGGLSKGALEWSNPGNTGTLGDLSDGIRFWTGCFSGGAQTELLVYVNKTKQLWLGTISSGQFSWANVGNTIGFGNINDGRPIWTGDFTGNGSTDFLFYFPGDTNWWLGRISDNAIHWNQAGSVDPTNGAGGTFKSFRGAFSAEGRDQILVYNPDSENWHLAAFDQQGTLTYHLAGNKDLGHLSATNYKVLIEDLTGSGTSELYIYSPEKDGWCGGTVSGDDVSFTSISGQTVGAADKTQYWTGNFTPDATAPQMVVFNEGNWYLASRSGAALNFTQFQTLTPGLVFPRNY